MAKKKRKGVTSRIVYNQDYYKAQALLRDPWFIEKVSWLKKRFNEVGCPLPRHGFKKYKQYDKWRDKYWDRYSEMGRSPEFISGKKEITRGKERISLEEYNRLDTFQENYLPPVYGAVISDILEYYEIPKDKKYFYDFVEWYIFLNRKELLSPIMQISMKRDPKTGKREMFVQIFEYTKKEDIVNNWDFIVDMQKYLTGYIGKSKKWERFDRDFEVYTLYKKLKVRRDKDKDWEPVIDREIYIILHGKYNELTVNKIRNIISTTAKRLGETTT
jgi:hypothetical protein